MDFWLAVTRNRKRTPTIMSEETLNYDDYSDDVDLDPQNRPVSNRIERFKGETGKTYRCALLYFHPLAYTLKKALEKKAARDGKAFDPAAYKETVGKALAKRAAELEKDVTALEEWEKLDWSNAQFKKYLSYYHTDVGSVLSRLGKDGPEADKVWKALGDAREYYSTIGLFYPLDASGNVDTKNIVRDAYVKLWRFSKGTFNALISKNEMLGSYNQSLANSDLRLHCKAAQYQTFDIDPAGSALWLKSASVRDKFLPMAHALYGKLIDARELSTAEVREKLNLASGGGDSGTDVAEDEIEDILSNV
jgi:hypothetical protein